MSFNQRTHFVFLGFSSCCHLRSNPYTQYMQPIYEQMSQEFKLAHHFSAPLSGFQPVSEKTREQTVYFCSIGAVRVKSKVSNDTNTMWNDCNVTLPSSLTIPVAVWMCVCVCARVATSSAVLWLRFCSFVRHSWIREAGFFTANLTFWNAFGCLRGWRKPHTQCG